MYTHIQNLQLGGVFLPKGLVTCELICIISHLPKTLVFPKFLWLAMYSGMHVFLFKDEYLCFKCSCVDFFFFFCLRLYKMFGFVT